MHSIVKTARTQHQVPEDMVICKMLPLRKYAMAFKCIQEHKMNTCYKELYKVLCCTVKEMEYALDKM